LAYQDLKGKIMENIEVKQASLAVTGEVRNLIYSIRNQQVMLDSDLAMLYQVETKVLNQAVKRNILRFPEIFRFQLTKDEYENLKSQIVTSSLKDDSTEHGGRRKLPYVFTEQGIAMLSAVLKSEIAIAVSIRIMESFVEMRKYMANTALIHQRLDTIELRQITCQKETDERFDKVFDYIAAHEESEQRVFFDGQIYDAFSLIVSLIKKANSELILIDNYVDIDTLNLLTKKNKNVKVTIYTLQNTNLTNTDVTNFNKQYPKLTLQYTKTFHDRFLIIDNKYAYHIGASIKDAGKRCFAINLIQEMGIINGILQQLNIKNN
jgi:hypothetical protein